MKDAAKRFEESFAIPFKSEKKRVKFTITAEVENYNLCECGKEYHSGDAIYCSHCGRKLNKSAENTAQ